MEKEIRIGAKVAINGGKRSDGKIRLLVYLPQRIVDNLKIMPGDELEIGEVYKTGLNLLNKRGGFLNKKPSKELPETEEDN